VRQEGVPQSSRWLIDSQPEKVEPDRLRPRTPPRGWRGYLRPEDRLLIVAVLASSAADDRADRLTGRRLRAITAIHAEEARYSSLIESSKALERARGTQRDRARHGRYDGTRESDVRGGAGGRSRPRGPRCTRSVIGGVTDSSGASGSLGKLAVATGGTDLISCPRGRLAVRARSAATDGEPVLAPYTPPRAA